MSAEPLPSCLTLCILWTVACQAPLSMGFSRQEYLGGLSCCPPGDLSDPGISLPTLCLLHWQVGLYHHCYVGNPRIPGRIQVGKAPYCCGRSESRVFCTQHCTTMENATFLPFDLSCFIHLLLCNCQQCLE